MPVRLPGTDTLFDHQETPVYPLVDQISCIIHHLCNVSIADFNVCREEALFRSSIPCDEDVYEMCVIIMRRDQSEPPSNFSEAVELYTHLQQDILQML